MKDQSDAVNIVYMRRTGIHIRSHVLKIYINILNILTGATTGSGGIGGGVGGAGGGGGVGGGAGARLLPVRCQAA